jgi:hypothetical protein
MDTLGESPMSENINASVEPKGDAGPSVNHDRMPPNARMQWMADLVCAILDAETDRKATVIGSRDGTSRHAAGNT